MHPHLIGVNCAPGRSQHISLSKGTRPFAIALLSLVLAVLSPRVYAFGLGDILVDSYLGQPFDARIDLRIKSIDEMEDLSVRLAPMESLELIGLDAFEFSTPLEFKVFGDAADPHIRISSWQPINDPIVRFVVEVNFANGRMLREFIVFMDPPTFNAPVPLPSVTPMDRSEVLAAPSEPYVAANSDPDDTVAEPEGVSALKSEDVAAQTPPQAQSAEQASEALGDSEPVMSASEPEALKEMPQDPEPEEIIEAETETEAQVKAEAQTENEEPAPTELLSDDRPQADHRPDAEDGVEDAPVADPMETAPGDDTGTTEDAVAPEELDQRTEDGVEDAPLADPIGAAPGDDLGATEDAVAPEELDQRTEDVVEDAPVADPMETAPGDDTGTTEDAVSQEELDQHAEDEDQVVSAEMQTVPASVKAYQLKRGNEQQYGPVEWGQTLWGIASKNLPEGISVYQAMLAIQRYNPDAFYSNNINRLKAGSILSLPPADEMARLSAKAASLEAMRQAQDFEQLLAGRIPEARPLPLLADLEEESIDAIPVSEQAEEVLPDARLELVSPEESEDPAASAVGAAGDSEEGEGQDGLGVDEALAEEDRASVEQESAYLAERMRELEEQLIQDDAPITLEDEGLAQMQERLREDRLKTSSDSDPRKSVVRTRQATPWYLSLGWWWLLPAVLLVLAVFWLLRRWDQRTAADFVDSIELSGDTGSARDAARELVEDAEDIVRGLSGEPTPERGDVEEENSQVEVGEVEASDEAHVDSQDQDPAPAHSEAHDASGPADSRPSHSEEAIELDQDDPEVKLDMARAYLSVGDSKAAIELLEEVVAEGDIKQAAEARSMMKEI